MEDQQLLDNAKRCGGKYYIHPILLITTRLIPKILPLNIDKKYNKVPNGYIAESYVGTMLIGEAINACQNKIDISCWKDYLDKIKNFPTIMGLATMDSRSDLESGKNFS